MHPIGRRSWQDTSTTRMQNDDNVVEAHQGASAPSRSAQPRSGGQPSGRFLIRRSQDANPLGDRNQLSQRLHLHLFHDLVAMGLDGAFRSTELYRDLFVDLAANHKFKHLSSAWRQQSDL